MVSTQIDIMQAKFKIGDEVWVMHQNKAISVLVYQHSIVTTAKTWCGINYKLLNAGQNESSTNIIYGLICSCPIIGEISLPETKCFTSKEELLKSL